LEEISASLRFALTVLADLRSISKSIYELSSLSGRKKTSICCTPPPSARSHIRAREPESDLTTSSERAEYDE
jgi:hypothetical protein